MAAQPSLYIFMATFYLPCDEVLLPPFLLLVVQTFLGLLVWQCYFAIMVEKLKYLLIFQYRSQRNKVQHSRRIFTRRFYVSGAFITRLAHRLRTVRVDHMKQVRFHTLTHSELTVFLCFSDLFLQYPSQRIPKNISLHYFTLTSRISDNKSQHPSSRLVPHLECKVNGEEIKLVSAIE